jgi:thiamine biosynthesis lipoprotein
MSGSLTLTVDRGRLRPLLAPRLSAAPEAIETFPCFGSTCTVIVSGSGPAGGAGQAARWARRRLLEWHARFSRFLPDSELSLLNRDPRATAPVSPAMARFVEAALAVAELTRGLVDPTLIGELERAGYAAHFAARPVPLREALALAPERAPATPDPEARWRQISVDRHAGSVTRPTGVRLDSGGVAKGLFADVLATTLSGHASFAVDAAGDLRFGGDARRLREVRVASPFDASILHRFELRRGAAATSGIGKRSWLDADGRPAHHLLDPGTGRPAFTGIVQATALAPSALEAEARAKAALLGGPAQAARWLRTGGVVVYEDGGFDVIAPGSELERLETP